MKKFTSLIAVIIVASSLAIIATPAWAEDVLPKGQWVIINYNNQSVLYRGTEVIINSNGAKETRHLIVIRDFQNGNVELSVKFNEKFYVGDAVACVTKKIIDYKGVSSVLVDISW